MTLEEHVCRNETFLFAFNLTMTETLRIFENMALRKMVGPKTGSNGRY
jgi:hypothetical protein